MNPAAKAVLLGSVISLPSYVIARFLGEGLNLLSPHNPIGAGVVAGGTVMALVAIILQRLRESE